MEAYMIAVGAIAFISELIDSSLGMGYGTILTPLLLLLGYEPGIVVPSVLISEFASGILAAILHQCMGNVRFIPDKGEVKSLTQASKVALIITASSVVAAVIAALVAISLPSFYIKLYIGLMIVTVGIVILIRRNKKTPFSWTKIAILGGIASFNKGISGGGYGPVVTGGQLLSGMDGKSAIAITSLAEGITCLAGASIYIASGGFRHLSLAPFLTGGALLSVPLSAFVVKWLPLGKLTIIIGIITLFMGLITLVKLFLS